MTTTAPRGGTPDSAFQGVSSVFLGGPFMGLVDSESGRMSDRDCQPFTVLIEHFERQGLHVYNAHRREAWGAEVMPPDECTALDQRRSRKRMCSSRSPASHRHPGPTSRWAGPARSANR